MAKWLTIFIVGLSLLFLAASIYNSQVVNPRVEETIRTEPDGEQAGIVALLTFANGKTIPVNYLREDNLVFLGADGPWWREFPDTSDNTPGAPVQLFIRGKTLQGLARTELMNQPYIDEIFARLRPNAPEWLPDWLNGKLVIIELKES